MAKAKQMPLGVHWRNIRNVNPPACASLSVPADWTTDSSRRSKPNFPLAGVDVWFELAITDTHVDTLTTILVFVLRLFVFSVILFFLSSYYCRTHRSSNTLNWLGKWSHVFFFNFFSFSKVFCSSDFLKKCHHDVSTSFSIIYLVISRVIDNIWTISKWGFRKKRIRFTITIEK
jgi:hypothetical protein